MSTRKDRQPKKPLGRLTQELEERIPYYRMKWRSLAFATQPIRHAEAEDLVRRTYRAFGKTPPERFVWAGSPAEALAAAALLESTVAERWWLHDNPYNDWHALEDIDSFLDRHDRDRMIALLRDPWVENLNAFLLSTGELGLIPFWSKSWKLARSRLEQQGGVYLSDGTIRTEYQWVGGRLRAWRGAEYGAFAACEVLNEVAGHPVKRETRLLARLMQHFGPFYYAANNVAVLIERPTYIALDEAGRVHHDFSPAVNYRGGIKIYAWHGVAVPPHVITAPRTIEVHEIERERNSEVRRVMIERMGWERYLHRSNAMVLDECERGTLLVLPHQPQPRDEALRMLRVQNSTPEPDGTRKNYFIRVPPTVMTAKEAVAWTFGMTEKDYAPLNET